MSGLIAAEGGYQEFVLKGGEWAVLWLSAAAALLAIAVGFFLVRSVMAADEGSPKMKEIAGAIQEGAWADLLLIDGDPLADIDLIADPQNSMVVIMKAGEILKNTLVQQS